MTASRLPRRFYCYPARQVARALLGKVVITDLDSCRRGGRIVEVEAYCDAAEPDLACHGDRANGGRPTDRTSVMFGPPGHAYVYFTYGMHWMFNIVTGVTGVANAVLVRALEPLSGLAKMRAARGFAPEDQSAQTNQKLTTGPARLAQALGIGKENNGSDLCAADSRVWIMSGPPVPSDAVQTGPRVGLGKTPEPWLSAPWRYWDSRSPFISRR